MLDFHIVVSSKKRGFGIKLLKFSLMASGQGVGVEHENRVGRHLKSDCLTQHPDGWGEGALHSTYISLVASARACVLFGCVLRVDIPPVRNKEKKKRENSVLVGAKKSASRWTF